MLDLLLFIFQLEAFLLYFIDFKRIVALSSMTCVKDSNFSAEVRSLLYLSDFNVFRVNFRWYVYYSEVF